MALAYNAGLVEEDEKEKARLAAAGGGTAAAGAAAQPVAPEPKPPAQPGTPAQPAPPATTAPPTFTQLQAAGQPRPAPPPVAMDPVLPTGALGSPLRGTLQQQIANMLANPSSYGTEAVQRERERGARGIDDQYKQQETSLREELVRRGLGQAEEGTIGLGRLSDLNIGRRSAQVELEDRLQTKLAETQSADLRAAIAQAMGLEGLTSEEQRFEKELAFRGGEGAANRAMSLEELKARREESAADRAARAGEFASRLGLDTRELGIREKESERSGALQDWEKAFREKEFGLQTSESQREGSQWEKDYQQRKEDADRNDLLALLRELFGQDFFPSGGNSSGSGGGTRSGTPPAGGSSGGGYYRPTDWMETLLAQYMR